MYTYFFSFSNFFRRYFSLLKPFFALYMPFPHFCAFALPFFLKKGFFTAFSAEKEKMLFFHAFRGNLMLFS